MSRHHFTKIALIGNPNCGKSTLFNQLTGLNQKVGNFAGVTVERKSGIAEFDKELSCEIIDLPGTYSIYPKSFDERIVFNILTTTQSEDYPDIIIVVVDSSNLKRNLLLFSQLYDLGTPMILVLNMIDVAEKAGISIQEDILSKSFGGIKVVSLNARKGIGLPVLKAEIKIMLSLLNKKVPFRHSLSYTPENSLLKVLDEVKKTVNTENTYLSILISHLYKQVSYLSDIQKNIIENILIENQFDSIKTQTHETISRYQKINEIVNKAVKQDQFKDPHKVTSILDKVLTHKVFGYATLVIIFILIFQSIFTLATYPMDLIDNGITTLNDYFKNIFPDNIFIDLLTNGLIAGLGGILIFVPQIAILFAFIAILEETGYMSRVMFLMDNLMKPFGLNGKSIVPLFSGAACAIPAIMAARNIGNRKERLITIFVTPLISCSARIPVYTIIIALIIPPKEIFGFISLQGVTMMIMYILGFAMALITAFILKYAIKTEEKSFFILEMPDYKMPKWKNIGYTVVDKVKSFLLGAGKIIISISIVLWFLATFGPKEAMENAEKQVNSSITNENLRSTEEFKTKVAAAKLEASYAGHFGKFIEPAIAPLGFDWKIGIAILTSFVAREVFVGTISTIYSVGTTDVKNQSMKEKLMLQKDPKTGEPFFNFARGMSLLVFYAFALQCMSTIAIVKKETGKWGIAFIQFIYLSALAYFASYLTYSIFS